MKRKLFTLLLAIVGLTAFQANAQDRRIRILADTSGLAKTKTGTETWRSDSFPKVKTDLYGWLSVNKDGKFVVSSVDYEKKDTATFRQKLYGDPNSVFSLGFKQNTTDSANFKFRSKDGTLLEFPTGDGSTEVFQILQWSTATAITGGKWGKFVSYGNLRTLTDVLPTSSKEGYLVYAPATADSMRLDTIEFALVGANKAGELSLKYFNEFAISGDSLPYAPWWKYQYDGRFEKGKMYQSSTFPYFQIYDTDNEDGPEGFLKGFEHNGVNVTGKASNWGNNTGNKPNPNDPLVYTSLDIKLAGDSAIVLMDTTIRLDSIFYVVDTLSRIYLTRSDTVGTNMYPSTQGDFTADSSKWKRHWQGFGVLDENVALKDIWKFGIPTNEGDGSNDTTRMRVYLTEKDGQLSFTVRKDSSSNYSAAHWSNGEPKKFAYYTRPKNNGNKKINGNGIDDVEFRYYYIDTGWTKALQHILLHFVLDNRVDSLRDIDSIGQRYIYKDNDDWRPLYVKLEKVVEDKKLARYVGKKWIENDENKYHLSAALQSIVGTNPLSSVSKGEEVTVVLKDDASAARFSFVFADSISKNTHWFTKNSYYNNGKPLVGNKKDARTFVNKGDSIELFYIKYDGKYLTALNSSDYLTGNDNGVASLDHVVTNTQLGWLDSLTSQKESVRQMFAIVRDYTDGNITFLPVASRIWHRDANIGQPKYDTDTLTFNLNIGAYVKLDKDDINDSVVDLQKTWHIYQVSPTGYGQSQRLVIVDTLSPAYIWFNLESALKPWDGHEVGKIASIKKVADGKYYRGDGDRIDAVTANDIRAHWRIDRKNIEKNKWKFTPVIDNIYGKNQNQLDFSKEDSIAAFEEDGNIILTSLAEPKAVLDTVQIFYDIDLSEGKSFFVDLDKYVKEDKLPTIALAAGSGEARYRYIAFGQSYLGDSIHEAVLREHAGNDYTYLTLYKSNVQWLDTAHLYGKVPYYVFSHEVENKKYFLALEKDSLRWIRLSEDHEEKLLDSKNLTDPTRVEDDPYAPYKFALSKKKDNSGNYMQALSATMEVAHVTGNGAVESGDMKVVDLKAEITDKKNEGVFGALDFYNLPTTPIQAVTWQVKSNGDYDEWVSIAEADSLGVLLAVAFSQDATFIGSKKVNGVRYGVLTPDPSDITLKLKRVDSEDVPEVEASQSISISDKPTFYHIIREDSLYLTDSGEDVQVSFVRKTADKHQEFAFSRQDGEGDDVRFTIVSIRKADDYHYLSSSAVDLVFSAAYSKAIKFQWSKREYTGIKAINASPAKVYGVAGGVKVANATGAVSIYTIDGRLVTTQAVTSPNRTIAVPAGIYIVRNGAEVAKVIVK